MSYQACCQKCGDHGFTGCPEAITETGDLIVVAFRKGVACSCGEGAWFAQQQMRWWELAS